MWRGNDHLLARRACGQSFGQPDPSDLTFQAMARQQLGQRDAARATLTYLRERMQQPKFKDNAEAQSFLREAETLIEPG